MANNRGEVIRTSLSEQWHSYVAQRRRSVVLLDVIGPAVLTEVAGPSTIVLVIGAFVLFLGLPLIEALVYLAFKWGNFKRSYTDAFVVNLITTLLGFALGVVAPNLVRDNPLGAPSVFLVAAFALSVLFEGAILVRLKRQPAGRTWLVAIASNVVRYALLLIFVNLP